MHTSLRSSKCAAMLVRTARPSHHLCALGVSKLSPTRITCHRASLGLARRDEHHARSFSSSFLSQRCNAQQQLQQLVRSFHSSTRVFAAPSTPSSNLGLGPNGGRLVEFMLADIGEGIAECEILKWFVNEGTEVQQFDKVCEVQSDKANVEITSRYDGVVRQLKYKVGGLAKVGKPLLVIELAPTAAGTTSSSSSSSSPSTSSSSSSSDATSTTAEPISSEASSSANAMEASLSKFLTSPSVRRLAKEHSVDLSLVTATGPQGRILKEDVLAYLDNAKSSPLKQQPQQLQPAKPQSPPQQAQPVAAVATPSSVGATASSSSSSSASSSPSPSSSSRLPSYMSSDVVVPVSGIQRIMVQTMTAAAAVPTFGFSDEVNMDGLTSIREQLKPICLERGVKLSYLPFIIKATSLALRSYPQLNAHVSSDCTSVTQRAAHNIGIAMDTPRGLLVPNVKNVEQKSVFEIAAELNRLSQLGTAGKLGREDLTGGTFSLSNIGSVGGTYMRPILVVPEVVIGALGGIQVVPRFDKKSANTNTNVVAASIMNVSWTADHRVLDGATVARFSMLFKAYLEKPAHFILDAR